MKAKLTFLVEMEYEIDPQNYPKGSTPEQILAIDLEAASDDPFLSLGISGEPKWTITGEIVSDSE